VAPQTAEIGTGIFGEKWPVSMYGLGECFFCGMVWAELFVERKLSFPDSRIWQ